MLAHAETAVDTLPQTRFESLKRPKVLMHTWLAWQNEPGKPYGQAITARYLDASLPTGAVFADWLKRVFFRIEVFGQVLMSSRNPSPSEYLSEYQTVARSRPPP